MRSTMTSSLTRRLAQMTLRTTTASSSFIKGSSIGGGVASLSSLSSSKCLLVGPSLDRSFGMSMTMATDINNIANNNSKHKSNLLSLTGSVRYMSKGNKKKRDAGFGTSNSQHEEWVKFQQSIAVDGFETGQSMGGVGAASNLLGTVATRGGKQMRKRKERALELAKRATGRDRMDVNLGGGQFPPLRYSDEETERLLALAYSHIPPRAGKRGTRNLKRQKVRWARVRAIRAKQKHFKVLAHYRRMEKRSRIVREVLEVKRGAEEIRAKDRAYQQKVLMRWADIVGEDLGGRTNESEGAEQVIEVKEGGTKEKGSL